MRLHLTTLLGLALLSSSALAPDHALAAPTATTTASKPEAKTDPNPLIATVNDQAIHLDDVKEAAEGIPPQLRQLPANTIIGMLVEQLIRQKAIQIDATKEGLENRPAVKAMMQQAANGALQNAYLQEKVAPLVSEENIKKYYDTHYVTKKGEKELHARHILVADEKTAKNIINQLNHGAKFDQLAKKLSTDKVSGASGGDLGWFKKEDMLPTFSEAVFQMKKGTISQTPIKTQYGYHVVQLLDSRIAPVPPLAQVHDEIRQKLVREGVSKVVEAAQKKVKIVRYDAQGEPIDLSKKPSTPKAK